LDEAAGYFFKLNTNLVAGARTLILMVVIWFAIKASRANCSGLALLYQPIGEVHTLKRFLSVIGGLFLVLVLLIAGFFGYAAYQGRGLDASSKAYVEENIPAIISTWSKDELLKRSSPQLLTIINEKPEQLDRLFQKLSTLGPMLSFGEVKGDSNVSYTTQNGKVTTAAYVAAAKFKNGEGRISARLIQSPAGQWQFLLFHVDAPLFLQ
jgi:hypothetical protein